MSEELLRKEKTVKIKDKKTGKINSIPYRPVDLSKLNEKEILCFKECKYSKVCDKLPDPSNMEDNGRCFTDFCSSLGDKTEENNKGDKSLEDPSLCQMVPKEGSLEELFKDKEDILQLLIKKGTLININEFIDKVCPKCKFSENKMCLLRDIFLKESE